MLIGSAINKVVDATAEIEVLEATFSEAEPVLAVARVDLLNGIQGGTYQAAIYINGSRIEPVMPVVITKPGAVLQSRDFIVSQGDVVSVRIIGGPGDAALAVTAYVVTAGFNQQELADSLSQLEVRPTVYVLKPIPKKTIQKVIPIPRDNPQD